MIPQRIVDYLRNHSIPFERRTHRRAITAPELVDTLHVPGRRIAKTVLVKAGERVWIAVLPATDLVDEKRLAAVVGAPDARVLREPEFVGLFPDCEPGSEPPFGRLYGLSVVIDAALADEDRIVFRAGSHHDAIEMRYEDFYRLEGRPKVSLIGRARAHETPVWTDWHDWCSQ